MALRATPDPVILHVRRPGYQSEFAHWVLYLGCDGNSARVLDPPGDAQDIPLAELLATWDGVGIAVEGHAGSSWELRAGTWVVLVAVVAGLVTTLAGVRIFIPRVAGRTISGMVIVPAVSCVAALGFHAGWASGFLRAPGAAGEVARRYFDAELPTVTAQEFAGIVASSEATIIDCRMERDYRRGHVSGAVSLPISASTAERSKVMATIPPDRRVVVYCQSEGCLWSRQIGGDLYHRGYHDVVVFREGWVGWMRHEHDRGATAP